MAFQVVQGVLSGPVDILGVFGTRCRSLPCHCRSSCRRAGSRAWRCCARPCRSRPSSASALLSSATRCGAASTSRGPWRRWGRRRRKRFHSHGDLSDIRRAASAAASCPPLTRSLLRRRLNYRAGTLITDHWRTLTRLCNAYRPNSKRSGDFSAKHGMVCFPGLGLLPRYYYWLVQGRIPRFPFDFL